MNSVLKNYCNSKRERGSLKNKKEKAITLIALVITIIVLLILAGVTVATLTGENGLLSKAQLAKERTTEAEQDEKDKLTTYEKMINGDRETITLTESELNQKIDIAVKAALQKQKEDSEIGKVYTTTFEDLELVKGGNYSVATLTLPAGKYLFAAESTYKGSDLRFIVYLPGVSNSSMDNDGWVSMGGFGFGESNEEKTYSFGLYLSKAITLSSGTFRAVKIADY